MTEHAVTAAKESVEEFGLRARGWLAANMPRIDRDHPPTTRLDQEASWRRAR